MNTKIKIFESGIADGIMSKNQKFYPENYTPENIKEEFLNVRLNLGKKYGFDGKKIFQAKQKTETNGVAYPNGKYVVLSDKYMQKEDFWDEEIETDILIMPEQYKGIVLGNQMADCPILIVEDRKLGVTALSHCGASYIDRQLPKETVESLFKEYKSFPEDLYVYIGSSASKENYIYDRYPAWATDSNVWEGYIIKENDDYHIDMLGAIEKQLRSLGITNIEKSSYDTISSPKYYSHRAAMRGNKEKLGQNFVGFYYL